MANHTARSNILSFAEAKQKCNEKYSCFVEIETQERIALSPYYIGRIKQGVHEEIKQKILRWEFLDEYGGIIVAYDNIKLLQKSAEIYDESPLLHFDIKVNYIIFKPEVGKKLVGVVNMTSECHIGCVVHERFNASLADPSSCKNGWVGSNPEIGTEFIFRVSDMSSVAGLLFISGHIKEKDMKYTKNLDSNQNHRLSLDQSQSTAKDSKHKKTKPIKSPEKLDIDLINQNSHKREKKKRRKHDKQSPEDSTSKSDLKESHSPAKKRKKKSDDG